MRLTLRFLIPLGIVLGTLTYLTVPLVDRLTLQWFVRDLDMRARLMAETAHDRMAELVRADRKKKLQGFLDHLIRDERLFAIGVCDPSQRLTYSTTTFPKPYACEKSEELTKQRVISTPGGLLHLSAFDLADETGNLGKLILIHDMSFIQRRSADSKRYLFLLLMGILVIVSVVTVVVAQLSWRGWMEGVRTLLKGEALFQPIPLASRGELQPIMNDLHALVRSLDAERRQRDESRISWTAKTLKEILRNELYGEEILIVSNREPYIHNLRDGKVEVQVPASGVVTALEPIMRACSGTWIAHGSGSADRSVVDSNDRLGVPPEKPQYQIRRIWLTQEEEQSYYYGFSNEGLWPLCHVAHIRPTFRSTDFEKYVAVNRKFAQAITEESKTEEPVILVQDYHFSLLPRMIRETLPKATIIMFWHCPWPNPEAFGICPWRNEILEGLLGSSILGFHTRFHCHNFIDTVDRYLESRIERETSTISYLGKLTAIKPYPISIEWPSRWMRDQVPVFECRSRIREAHGLSAEHCIAFGVERLDYTKGIPERFLAIDRFLEKNPDWIGRFSFIQIAAPTRFQIEQYRRFRSEVEALAEKINSRYQRPGYQAIILKLEHHQPPQVFEYFRAADLCMVTSLHDGMNLVAKEFIASRDDDRGVLVLSQFTGAYRELPEALIVNPYDIEQCADAIRTALDMPISEQRDRMRTMRGLVQEFNVYRWAGKMLLDASYVRQRNRFLGRFGKADGERTHVL